MQCPHCQHENSATAKFCEACGTTLTGQPSASSPAQSATQRPIAPEPAPLSYPLPAPGREIRTTRRALEGERKADVQEAKALLGQLAYRGELPHLVQ